MITPVTPHPVFPEVRLLSLSHFEDERGSMSRIYDREIFQRENIPCEFVQTSHSHTSQVGILRGLSVSLPPYREAKLITCTGGCMQWVVVDLRLGSPTLGRWGEILLEPGRSVFVPVGFAHGCLSLRAPVDLILSADQPFQAKHFSGIRYDDPQLAIAWRMQPLLVSSAHLNLPSLSEILDLLTP